MSSISNRFYIKALDDGTTLHGNLAADNSLSQAWNGYRAIPDWTDPTKQPLIYLTLLMGSRAVAPAEGYRWLYNTEEIEDSDPRFQKTTRIVQGVTMPALRIVANLANSDNVDVDLITFEGSYFIEGAELDFAVTTQVRISTISEGSSLGIINFHNGVADITEKGQTITAYGQLYNPDGTMDNTATTKWYLNDSETPTSGTTIQGHPNAYNITEANVVDHATIRCDFYSGAEKKYTAYASVDDMQDPEFMYIQYNGNNGNASSLRVGETAEFHIWVGTRTSPEVQQGWTFKVKLIDGDGIPIGGSDDTTVPPRNSSYPGIPAVDNVPPGSSYDPRGYRTLSKNSDGHAVISPAYDTVVTVAKKNLTGIIIATTEVPNS